MSDEQYNLTEREIEALFSIVDEQAENSEYDPDSDAEDTFDHRNRTNNSCGSDGEATGVSSPSISLIHSVEGNASTQLDMSFFSPTNFGDINYSENDTERVELLNLPSTSTDGLTLRPRKPKEFNNTCDSSSAYDDNLFSDDDTDKDPTFSPEHPIPLFPLDSPDNISENEKSDSNDAQVLKLDTQVKQFVKISKKLKLSTKRKLSKNLTGPKNYNKKRFKKEEIPTYIWQRSSKDPEKYANSSFTKGFGPKNENCETPIKSFGLFFGDDIFSHIVDQSNLFASQSGVNLDLSLAELKAFCGILIIMGFHELPSIRMYWSTDPNLHVARIASIMTVKRFLKILRFLHVNDNKKMPARGTNDYDKLFKIRPLIDYVNKKCKERFQPSRNLSIDESMIAFKGRSTMKQYMPMKPIKRGFKVWAIACAQTGYIYSFEVYTGKTSKDASLGLGEKVVLSLCSGLEHNSYCVHFDNFFSSVPLVEKLLGLDIFACCTFRSDRKHYPKIFLPDAQMEHGQFDRVQCGDLTMCKWKDHGKKSVSVVSNYHNSTDIVKVLRGDNVGQRHQVDCPSSIADYNKWMGGVDRFDALLANYNISWKTRRWWMKFFYFLLDMSIINSFVSYKTLCKLKKINNVSHLKYRSQLANDLIIDYSSRKRSGPAPGTSWGKKNNKTNGHTTVPNAIRLAGVGSHIPEVGTYRRCAFCSTKAKQKRSNLYCKECKVGLCKGCFAPFHRS